MKEKLLHQNVMTKQFTSKRKIAFTLVGKANKRFAITESNLALTVMAPLKDAISDVSMILPLFKIVHMNVHLKLVFQLSCSRKTHTCAIVTRPSYEGQTLSLLEILQSFS